MLQTPPFKGANVFMSRKLVPPEIFDALHDALKLNGANVALCCDPTRNGPDDFHVIASSDHEKCEDLRAKGCQLLGPQCVFSCASEHRSLPKRGFTCCLALDGVNVLASGFEADEKVKIRNLVTSMGGVLHTKASLDVNFVIAKNVLAAKYKWALNTLKKPVLTINWLYQCCNEHRIVPQESFRVLPVSGLTISVTRLPADERKKIEKLITENGGQYSGELTRKCTHLICDTPEGDKYNVARMWGHIYIVTRKWLDQSIARRACLNEESFPVHGGSLSSKRIVKGCFSSQNSQSKCSGNLQAVPPSVVADSSFTAAPGGNVDSDLEATVSQTMLPIFSCAPLFCKEGDSSVPPLESKCEVSLEEIVADDSQSEDNELYLSECKISLVGFEASEMRRLVSIIRRGGGSRYMSFNDRLTHIVVGTPSEIEKKEVRGFAGLGVIHVVRASWLEDCHREKKEIPVLQRHRACDILLPKGALMSGTGGTIQGKISNIPQRMPSDQLCGNTNGATRMDSLEKNREEVSEINRVDNRSEKEAVTSFDKNKLPVLKDKSKVQLLDKTRGQQKIQHQSSVQKGKPSSSVFKGKLFRFSNFFPEERRGEIIEWVNQGGGLVIDAHCKQKAHFTIECHGVIPRSVGTTQTTYVSSHWIRLCLEDGCLLNVSKHILYTPLPCRTPLPGFESFRFSVSQYEEKDRLLLRNLCFTLGAKFVERFDRKVTHLLCKFASGSKYEAACKKGIHRITCDWLYECVKQNKVIALDQFYPKEVTAEDREAGVCTTSQYPTQDVQMISVGNSSQCRSQSQDRSFSPPKAIGRRINNFREEAKDSSGNKKARVLEDVDQSNQISLHSPGISLSIPSYTTEYKKVNTSSDVPQVVPDVASAIEDLLEMYPKIHDQNSPGSSFATDCAMPGQDQDLPGSHSVSGLSRHAWSKSAGQKDDINYPYGKQTAGEYDSFSETQTESQVVGYEEDFDGRQMLLDKYKLRRPSPSPSPTL